ncbi:hypothetical protein Bca52824_070361 [Brassica carinata]|uniref:RRM domain-containing protein n=1 Tax=Brassica carinata TaxID=52824 RepID=A0A8X7U259_BRACI|nr:hypothetical protein Bca52824_070361 [Brassica carinata]
MPGLAYVDFVDDEDLAAAIAKNRKMFLGKKISIERSNPKKEEPIVQIKPWSQVSDLRSSRSYSNQQCVVPNPAFGVPIVVAVPAKRLLGTFGCVIGLSSNVVRCLFPCFST